MRLLSTVLTPLILAVALCGLLAARPAEAHAVARLAPTPTTIITSMQVLTLDMPILMYHHVDGKIQTPQEIPNPLLPSIVTSSARVCDPRRAFLAASGIHRETLLSPSLTFSSCPSLSGMVHFTLALLRLRNACSV